MIQSVQFHVQQLLLIEAGIAGHEEAGLVVEDGDRGDGNDGHGELKDHQRFPAQESDARCARSGAAYGQDW